MKIKYYIAFLILSTFLAGCNKEKIIVEGKFTNLDEETFDVKMISVTGKTEKSFGKVKVEGGEIILKVENISPPVKFTFTGDSVKTFHIWVDQFGKTAFEASCNEKIKILWVDNFMSKELKKIKLSYHEKYIVNVEDYFPMIVTLQKKLDNHSITDEELRLLDKIEPKVKKAKKLYKKNVLATFRASPLNPIALALMFDEWEQMTSWQKDEVKKAAFKSCPGSGLYWQLSH